MLQVAHLLLSNLQLLLSRIGIKSVTILLKKKKRCT